MKTEQTVELKPNGKPVRARDRRRAERERVNRLAQAADEEWQRQPYRSEAELEVLWATGELPEGGEK